MSRDEQGFTLIELLVVILIIAILSAIAIPVFLSQRVKGWEAQMKSVLKNAAGAVESYAVDAGGSYSGVDTTDYPDYMTKLKDNGFVMPAYMKSLKIESDSGNYFCIEIQHTNLPGNNAWRKGVYMSTEGLPQPLPNKCPKALF